MKYLFSLSLLKGLNILISQMIAITFSVLRILGELKKREHFYLTLTFFLYFILLFYFINFDMIKPQEE